YRISRGHAARICSGVANGQTSRVLASRIKAPSQYARRSGSGSARWRRNSSMVTLAHQTKYGRLSGLSSSGVVGGSGWPTRRILAHAERGRAMEILDPDLRADYKPRSRKRFTTMSFKMGLLARKLGMTQVFHEDGTALGCTVLQVGPCIVTAQRTPDKHGYAAVQLAFEAKPLRALGRPAAGQMKKAGLELAPRFLREVRLDGPEVAKYEVGKVLKAEEVFKAGDVVDAVGVTK